ncbi:MAG: hypothetical protein NTW96_22295 [Planctomycetia bacterium]|nr:hypothetical protein [Planctomycetia bacterium]
METHSIADVQDTVILERRGVDDNMDLGRFGVRRFIAAFWAAVAASRLCETSREDDRTLLLGRSENTVRRLAAKKKRR